MTNKISSINELKDEVKDTQRLVIRAANSDDTDVEEWSFIEKKLQVISKHLSQHIQHDNMNELNASEKSVIKLIHQYYIEMVDLIATKKQLVSEELRNLANREKLKSTYSK